MWRIDDALSFAIAVFLLIALLLMYARPRSMFSDNGIMKSFGLGQDDTCMPVLFLAVLGGIVGYLVYQF